MKKVYKMSIQDALTPQAKKIKEKNGVLKGMQSVRSRQNCEIKVNLKSKGKKRLSRNVTLKKCYFKNKIKLKNTKTF